MTSRDTILHAAERARRARCELSAHALEAAAQHGKLIGQWSSAVADLDAAIAEGAGDCLAAALIDRCRLAACDPTALPLVERLPEDAEPPLVALTEGQRAGLRLTCWLALLFLSGVALAALLDLH